MTRSLITVFHDYTSPCFPFPSHTHTHTHRASVNFKHASHFITSRISVLLRGTQHLMNVTQYVRSVTPPWEQSDPGSRRLKIATCSYYRIRYPRVLASGRTLCARDSQKFNRNFEYGTPKMRTAASKKMENVTNTNPRSFQRSQLGLSVGYWHVLTWMHPWQNAPKNNKDPSQECVVKGCEN
jgi:hypothetical protein